MSPNFKEQPRIPENQDRTDGSESELESKSKPTWFTFPRLTAEDYFVGLGTLLVVLAAIVKNTDIRSAFYGFGTLILLLEIYAHSQRGR